MQEERVMNRLDEVLEVIDIKALGFYLQRNDKKDVNNFVNTFLEIANSIQLGIGAVDSMIESIKKTIEGEDNARE